MTEDEQILQLFRRDIARLIRRRALHQRLLVDGLTNWKPRQLPESITRLLEAPCGVRE